MLVSHAGANLGSDVSNSQVSNRRRRIIIINKKTKAFE
jgi:hypothetical protein